MTVLLNLKNKQFGRLTALDIVGTYDKTGAKIWRCICSCGNFTDVKVNHLTTGKTRSCGCLWREGTSKRFLSDIRGFRFNRLLVVRRVANDKKNVMWECLCDCGNTATARGTSLRFGETESCGCLRSEGAKVRFTTHGESYTRGYRQNLTAIYRAAKLQRTPPWADMSKIKEIYKKCPKDLVVDHIIPLQGKLVSGLHVPNNLQYLTYAQNSSKKNKYTQKEDFGQM